MALDYRTALFAKDPLTFLRNKAINPPAQQGPKLKKKQALPFTDRNLRFFSQPEKIQGQQSRFKTAQIQVPIAWIRLLDDPIWPGACTFDLEFASGDEEARIQSADRLPVYYLPWQPDKFIRMTIPAYQEENVADFGIGRDHSGKKASF